MLERFKRWYNGETKIREFDNDPNSSIVILPAVYTDYHWSAKVARSLVAFYLKHWQWLWGTAIALAGLWVAILSLK